MSCTTVKAVQENPEVLFLRYLELGRKEQNEGEREKIYRAAVEHFAKHCLYERPHKVRIVKKIIDKDDHLGLQVFFMRCLNQVNEMCKKVKMYDGEECFDSQAYAVKQKSLYVYTHLIKGAMGFSKDGVPFVPLKELVSMFCEVIRSKDSDLFKNFKVACGNRFNEVTNAHASQEQTAREEAKKRAALEEANKAKERAALEEARKKAALEKTKKAKKRDATTRLLEKMIDLDDFDNFKKALKMINPRDSNFDVHKVFEKANQCTDFFGERTTKFLHPLIPFLAAAPNEKRVYFLHQFIRNQDNDLYNKFQIACNNGAFVPLLTMQCSRKVAIEVAYEVGNQGVYHVLLCGSRVTTNLLKEMIERGDEDRYKEALDKVKAPNQKFNVRDVFQVAKTKVKFVRHLIPFFRKEDFARETGQTQNLLHLFAEADDYDGVKESIHQARQEGIHVAELIKEREYDKLPLGRGNRTALMIAAQKSNRRIIDFLLATYPKMSREQIAKARDLATSPISVGGYNFGGSAFVSLDNTLNLKKSRTGSGARAFDLTSRVDALEKMLKTSIGEGVFERINSGTWRRPDAQRVNLPQDGQVLEGTHAASISTMVKPVQDEGQPTAPAKLDVQQTLVPHVSTNASSQTVPPNPVPLVVSSTSQDQTLEGQPKETAAFAVESTARTIQLPPAADEQGMKVLTLPASAEPGQNVVMRRVDQSEVQAGRDEENGTVFDAAALRAALLQPVE